MILTLAKEYGCTQLLQKLLFKASKQHSTEMIAKYFFYYSVH